MNCWLRKFLTLPPFSFMFIDIHSSRNQVLPIMTRYLETKVYRMLSSNEHGLMIAWYVQGAFSLSPECDRQLKSDSVYPSFTLFFPFVCVNHHLLFPALQTNVSFFQEFPRLKMMMHFEYEKNETDGGVNDHRDFRITNKTEVLQELQSAIATMAGEVYTW